MLKRPLKTATGNDSDLPAALRRPSAFLPIAMSLTALSLVLFHIAVHGTAREPDEGTVAHLWQLLMVLQIPIIALFAINRVRVPARSALAVLSLQLLAALGAVAPVWYYRL